MPRAQSVSEGAFPSTYESLLALRGVGEYTAAAVASIAFHKPHAVLDGNVIRVVARVSNDAADTSLSRVRQRFQTMADTWMDPEHPGDFNQAMMELGATVCLPRGPLCLLCPVASLCSARALGTQDALPVKRAKPRAARVEVDVVIAYRKGALLLGERGAHEVRMPGFWELPPASVLPAGANLTRVGEVRHTIVNTAYRIAVFSAVLKRPPQGYRFVPPEEYGRLPLTTISKKALALYKKFTS